MLLRLKTQAFGGVIAFLMLSYLAAPTAMGAFSLGFAPESSVGGVAGTLTKALFLFEDATPEESLLFNQGLHSFSVAIDFGNSTGTQPAQVLSTGDYRSMFAAGLESKTIAGTQALMDANAFTGDRLYGTLVSPNRFGVQLAQFTFNLGNTASETTVLTATATGAEGDWGTGAFGLASTISPSSIAPGVGSITAVPEPTSFALVGLAGVGALVWHRRQAKSRAIAATTAS